MKQCDQTTQRYDKNQRSVKQLGRLSHPLLTVGINNQFPRSNEKSSIAAAVHIV